MRFLVLGGTIFVGRHIVEAARQSGHTVTIFHRGKHSPDLFAGDVGVTTVLGDRTNADDMARLVDSGEWDAVIDTCGYVPRIVEMSARLLEPRAGRYCFVSTVSVYADWSAQTLTEDSPLAVLPDPTVETVTNETYGGLKVLCENAVRDVFGGERTLITRPGYIVGAHDPTDRFTYWVHRFAQGGDMVAPGDSGAVTQFVDVRDLAEWSVRLVESGVSGTFNVDGSPRTLAELLAAFKSVAPTDARLVPVPDDLLEKHGVTPGVTLPLWASPSPEHAATVDSARAVATGLTFRSLQDTLAFTLAWDQARTDDGTAYMKTLPPSKEAEILAAFQNSSNVKPG
ncbi:MAG: NAD-dependent epimerase/dehydratase family protein [Armatimonadetes bacterium]|nr:NAD-dependent epimerase/dehydratase family protein [Armatimonadota bacterium]